MESKEKEEADLLMMLHETTFYDTVQCKHLIAIEATKLHALVSLVNKYIPLREQLFNLRSCGMIQSDRVYLSRLEELIQREAKVKQEIEKL